MQLADLPATEPLAGYRAATFTPTEVIESVLARVADGEPTRHATYALDEYGARKTAGESTERWQRQDPAGPLDGVPVTVKENIATAGTPMPLGTAASTLVPKERDAPAAARLRETIAVGASDGIGAGASAHSVQEQT